MKFGLALPYNMTRSAAQLAQLAEDSGWDGYFLGDAIWCEDPMIGLAAAATATKRIRLGTLIVPAPLRRPWKIASETGALDQLSEGRMILGLGAGATWMGWRSFPDEVTDLRARAELLDETIDILTLLDQRTPFDYNGKHFHVQLTLLEQIHYPPKPLQQPRIPLWVPGIWPHRKSIQRTLRCDGLLVEVQGADGRPTEPTADHIRAITSYVQANRTLTSPFEIVLNGSTAGLDRSQQASKLLPFLQAGATWWIEGLWGEPAAAVIERIRQGPPVLA